MAIGSTLAAHKRQQEERRKREEREERRRQQEEQEANERPTRAITRKEVETTTRQWRANQAQQEERPTRPITKADVKKITSAPESARPWRPEPRPQDDDDDKDRKRDQQEQTRRSLLGNWGATVPTRQFGLGDLEPLGTSPSRPTDRVMYDAPSRGGEPAYLRSSPVDVSSPQLGVTGVTGGLTVPSIQQPLGPWERPQGEEEPQRFGWRTPFGLITPQPAIQAGRILSEGLSGVWDQFNQQDVPNISQPWERPWGDVWGEQRGNFQDSAAYERYQQDVAERNQEFGQRDAFGLSEAGSSIAGAWNDAGRIYGNIWERVRSGEAGWEDLGTAAATGLGTGLGTVGGAMNVTSWTADVARRTGNLMSGSQASIDYMMTRDLGNDATVGANLVAGSRVFWDALKATAAGKRGSVDLGGRYNEELGRFRQATVPTREQLAQSTPAEIERYKEFALLNWADPVSVETTFDELANRPATVTQLQDQARQLYEQSLVATDESTREQLWSQAADAYAQAYKLESAHPIEIVNQNTNIWAQLAYELFLPDVTDLIGGGFAMAGLSPSARRLSKSEQLVSTPVPRVANRLDDLVVGPATQLAEVVPERNTWQKFVQNTLGATGYTNAERAANDLTHLAATLLADVDTAGDARLLLTQLARDPAGLIRGMSANLFESAGLLNRAQDGLVQFGGMGMDSKRFKEALNVFRMVADEFLPNAKSLNTDGNVNKIELLQEFITAVRQGGYRRYGVATDLGNAPFGVSDVRVRTLSGGQAFVEYVGEGGRVLRQSEPTTLLDANKQAGNIRQALKGNGQLNQRSLLRVVGSAMRSVVTPFYILANPGTWATNVISAVSMAAIDGQWAWGKTGDLKNAVAKIYGGVPATKRTLEGVGGAASMGSEMFGGVWKKPGEWYSKLDEFTGERIVYQATTQAIKKMLPDALKAFVPVLEANGITDPKVLRSLMNRLYEVGRNGGDMTAELNRWLGGNTRTFNLSDVNPQWLDSLPPASQEKFHQILNTVTDPTEWQQRINEWADEARVGWENIVRNSPVEPQRHSWMKQENTQDLADIEQLNRMAQKYGVDPAILDEWKTSTAGGMKQIEQRLRMLTQMVAESADPNQRYLLYDIWGQINERTANVRQQLAEEIEKVYAKTAGMPPQQAAPIWQAEYFGPARQLWDERNAYVNELLEQGAASLRAGEDYTPQYSYWNLLERAAGKNESQLWDTMRLEPGSGRWDARLAEAIQAGRALTDKAIAGAFAAARRFNSSGAFDEIVSAEKNAQIAGAQAAAYLAEQWQLILDKKLKPADYFSIRNQTWRELRLYEGQVWGIAQYNIVQEGLNSERRLNLSFDAGPDGIVQLMYPVQRKRQVTNRMGPTPTKQTVTTTEWVVRREDGTVTRIMDNHVPAELKEQYKNVRSLREATEAEVQLELDNIASAQPLVADAEKIDPKVAKKVAQDLNLGNGANNPDLADVSRTTSQNTTAMGGAQSPDHVGLSASYALQQIEQARSYLLRNAQQILQPSGQAGPAQSLAILSEFRQRVLPQWDNIKFAAAEFANRQRSFTIHDATNKYRVDEMMALFQPYGFFWTRAVKNALERQLFQPQVWRRTTQFRDAMSDIREQEGDPQRYDGAMRVEVGGNVYYLNINPQKYLPTLAGLLHNDYADPESANSALGFAFESMQGMGMNAYPWWDAAMKAYEGKTEDIYVGSYFPTGKLIGWGMAKFGGNNVPNAMRPEWYEYNVGRELTTMVTEGLVTPEEAQMAQDILRQMRFGEKPLPEQAALFEDERLTKILDDAAKRAGNTQFTTALSSWLTGVGVKPFNENEKVAIEGAEDYYNRRYDPVTNPYGSKLAADATLEEFPEVQVRWGQSALADKEKARPGNSALLRMKDQERAQIYAERQAARNKALQEAEAEGRHLTYKELDTITGEDAFDARLEEVDKKYANVEYPERTGLPSKGMNPLERARWELEKILKASEDGRPVKPDEATATPEQMQAYYDELATFKAQQYDRIERDIENTLQVTPDMVGNPGFTRWLKEFEKITKNQYASELERHYGLRFASDIERRWNDVESLRQEITRYEIAEGERRVREELGEKTFALWEQYQALPSSSEERSTFAQQHPDVVIARTLYHDPGQYDLVKKKFGENAWQVYVAAPKHPGDEASEAELQKYYDQINTYSRKHPQYEELDLWVDGRSRPAGLPPEYYRDDFGRDHAEAVQLFGENIFDAERNIPAYSETNKRAYFAYMKAHPEIYGYREWKKETREMTAEEYMRRYPYAEEQTAPIDPDTYFGNRPYGTDRQPIGGTAPYSTWGDSNIWLTPSYDPVDVTEVTPAATDPTVLPITAATTDTPSTSTGTGGTTVTDEELGPPKTAQDYINQSQTYREAQARDAQWQGRVTRVTMEFGEEQAALWQQYMDLPKGDARKEFAAQNPEIKLWNMAAYNPDEYGQAKELFGQESLLTWVNAPAWDGTEETDNLRSQYWSENPSAFVVGAWMNGRPSDRNQEDEELEEGESFYNFGADYDTAKGMFGDDIWDIVMLQKQLPDDRRMRAQFYQQYPQYNEWSDWWYANLPERDDRYVPRQRSGPGYDSLGNRAFGSWGGGGGGYDPRQRKAYIDMPWVQGQSMNSSLWASPGQGRPWRPEWIRQPELPRTPPERILRSWR